MTAAIGDCNGDQIPDILVSRLGYGSLYMGSKQGDCLDRMMASGLGVLTAQYVGGDATSSISTTRETGRLHRKR